MAAAAEASAEAVEESPDSKKARCRV